MQNCFREHPDIYGAELDEDELEGELNAPETANSSGVESTTSSQSAGQGEKVTNGAPDHPTDVQGKRERAQAAAAQVESDHGEPTSESESAVPKAWHDSK